MIASPSAIILFLSLTASSPERSANQLQQQFVRRAFLCEPIQIIISQGGYADVLDWLNNGLVDMGFLSLEASGDAETINLVP